MESNNKEEEEEAMRSKSLAESMLQKGDFTDAKITIERAQSLFPGLDDVSQMLTICQVHCAAARPDASWFKVLDLAYGSNYSVVRKRYLELALLLHPDKNKFGGAESAFMLVEEAHRILLSDPKSESGPHPSRILSTKCTFCRWLHEGISLSELNTEFFCTSCLKTFISRPFYRFLKTKYCTNPVTKEEASKLQYFWTRCSFCGLREECLQTRLNTLIRCRCCLNDFIAYDNIAKYVPSVPDGVLHSRNAWYRMTREHLGTAQINQPPNKKLKRANCRYEKFLSQGFAALNIKTKFNHTNLITLVFDVINSDERGPPEFKFDSTGKWNRALLSDAMNRLVYPAFFFRCTEQAYNLVASRVNEFEESLFFHLDYIIYKLRKDYFRRFSGVTVVIEKILPIPLLEKARENGKLGPNEGYTDEFYTGPYTLLIRADHAKNDRCGVCRLSLDGDSEENTCMPYCLHGFHVRCLQKYFLEDEGKKCLVCGQKLSLALYGVRNRLKNW